MRSYFPGVLAVLLVVACAGDSDTPQEPVGDELRVVNGPVTCDACGMVELTVAGPDLDDVVAASLQNHATRASVEAGVEIRHVVGDSGLVLQIKVTFSGAVPAGEYDLLLDTVGPGGAKGALTVLRAVKVLRNLNSPPDGPTGTARISVTTTGAHSSAPYRVTVTPCDPAYICGQGVAPGDTISFALPAGTYTLGLVDVPEACSIAEPRTVEVTVVAYRYANVSFSVTCPPPGRVQVAVSVTGPDQDLDYLAVVGTCGGDSQDCGTQQLQAGSSVEFSLPPGEAILELTGFAVNCTVVAPNPRTVTVAPDVTTRVVFVVNCVAAGKVRVMAPNASPDPSSGFQVSIGACAGSGPCTELRLGPGESVEVTLLPGTYPVQLSGIRSNCTVTGANPVMVTVSAGITTDVTFVLTCTALPPGVARVSVSTSGSYRDAEFGVILISPLCDLVGCPERQLLADGFVEFSLSPGRHRFRLTGISRRCKVDGFNPAGVEVVSGRTTNLVFKVSCR